MNDTEEFLIVHRAGETEEPEDMLDPDEIVGLACGSCGGSDIREKDQAERWNPIEVWDGKLSVAQQSAEFSTVGFFCVDCQTDLIVNNRDMDVYDLLTYL